MPEHRIKFRGGWERLDLGSDPELARRSSLPVDWTPGMAGPVRLTRHFGRPAIDPSTESLRLELRQIPGLRRLYLNGVELGSPPDGLSDWDIPLTLPLPGRNTLVLEVVFDEVMTVEGWGSIALVIASGLGS